MIRLALAAVAAALVAGCGSAPAPRLYVLDAPPPRGGGGATAELTVYVGAVAVPEAVDRPQLVVRTGLHEVEALDGHRWAEPLRLASGRVVAAQIGNELGTGRAGAYPATALADADYRVQVEIQRIDSAADGAASIHAVWSVRRAGGGAPVFGSSSGDAQAPGGYDGLAAAYVRALAPVSRDIAAAIRALDAQR